MKVRAHRATPIAALVFGAVATAALAAGGHTVRATITILLVPAIGVALVVFRRVDAVAILGANVEDDRQQALTTTVLAMAFVPIFVVIVTMLFWDLAHGRDASPWRQLAALGALSYIGAALYVSWRR